MDAFNDPVLTAWRSYGDWGFKIVILGVIGEVIAAGVDFIAEKCCRTWNKKWKRSLRLAELMSGAILVCGLAMEYRGHKRETQILDSYNAQSYERANDAERETELIRSNNLVLQKELQPRRITLEQRTNFIALTRFLPKIPIKVVVGPQGFDTTDFAVDMREMLTMAGFKTNSDAGFWGINEEITGETRTDLQNPHVCDVYIFNNVPNHAIDWFTSPDEVTNANVIKQFVGTNEFGIYTGLAAALQKIGFSSDFVEDPALKPGQCAIYIPIKP